MICFLVSVTVICAFCVGYAIRRGTICAVMATRALIVDGKSSRFRAFGVAAAGSGAIIVPLHWALPEIATLSAGYPVTLLVLLAGAAFGLGAWINEACTFGTLAHLTGGNLRYAGTIVGMVFGVVLMAYSGVSDRQSISPEPSFLENPGLVSVLFVAALAVSLLIALRRRIPRWWRSFREQAGMRMGPYRSMLIVGILGGILYTLAGNWSYMAILSRRAVRLLDPSVLPDGWSALLCAAALVAGGISAASVHGDFRLRLPNAAGLLRSFAGGIVMGASAAIIPGGNGTLLVHGVPSLAPHAIAAYLAMVATLCACFLVAKRSHRVSSSA